MGVVITREDIRAYAEIDYIINHLNEKYREMVPDKLLKFFNDFKDPTIEIKVDPYVPLEKQGLQRYTLEILALLHLKYWCQDEERKQELYEKMKRNQLLIEAKLHEQFGVENIFAAFTIILQPPFKVHKFFTIFVVNHTDLPFYVNHLNI